MKHKHAELIKAWADGAEIEAKWKNADCDWHVQENFLWLISSEFADSADFRIKPEEKQPVVRWLWAKLVLGEWLISPVFRSKEEASKTFDGQVICLEWSRQEFPE